MMTAYAAAVALSVVSCLLRAEPTKTYVLTGRVLDAATGEPIALARVSDDRGAFTFSDALGIYSLPLTTNAGYEKAEAYGMFPAWNRTPSRPEGLQQDFRMFSRSTPVVEGQVTNWSSNPQPGARVRILNYAERYGHFVLTDSLGRYVLPLPPPGEYVISASLDTEGGATALSRGRPIQVPVEGHPTVDLSLETFAYASPPTLGLWSERRPPAFRLLAVPHRQPDWSESFLDSDYVRRVGGLEKAIDDVPGVLVR